MYQEKKEEEDLQENEDCVDAMIRGLEKCIKKGKEMLITSANNFVRNISTDRKTTKSKKINGKKNNRMDI